MKVIDVRPAFPMSHVIDLGGIALWASRELHTYRETLCCAKFTALDRRLLMNLEARPGMVGLGDIERCEACNALLQFAIANKLMTQRPDSMEMQFQLTYAFNVIRGRLESYREG